MNPVSSTMNTPGRVVTELVQDIAAQVIPNTLDVPVGRAQQPLHPVR